MRVLAAGLVGAEVGGHGVAGLYPSSLLAQDPKSNSTQSLRENDLREMMDVAMYTVAPGFPVCRFEAKNEKGGDSSPVKSRAHISDFVNCGGGRNK